MGQSRLPPTIYTLCPLDPDNAEIRLLKVEHAREQDGALRCAFYKASLNSFVPEFTAISYCWGQAEHDQVIYVGQTPVKVTKSVHAIVREVLASGATFFWIDQLCIDQYNTGERSNQVASMSAIYSQADRVLVYLGLAGEYTSLAVDFVEHYQKRLKDQNFPETRIAQVSTSASVSFVASRKPASCSDNAILHHVALGLADLLSRPFFKRLWVVQEVVLANSLLTVCGSRHFQWDVLRLAWLLFTRRPELASLLKSFVHINCDFATMRKASRLVKEHSNFVNRDLWDILDECSGLVTSEPRDKIYAVLGLAKRKLTIPVPDYARSVQDIYLEFSKHFVRTGHGLEIINAAVANDRQQRTGYPSWAPWFDGMDAREFRRVASRMSAARNTAPVVTLGRSLSDITVQGVIIDRLIDVGPLGATRGEKAQISSPEHEIFLEWIEKSLALLEAHDIAFPAASLTLLLLQESPKITQDAVVSAHTCLANASKEMLSKTLFDFIDSLRTLSGRSALRSRMMTFRFDQQQKSGGNITLLNDFGFQAIASLHGRRVFFTKQKRIGLASNAAAVGDDVAIISGGHTPYILREKGGLKEIYSLVTWAYVQGIMHGEALKENCQIDSITIE